MAIEGSSKGNLGTIIFIGLICTLVGIEVNALIHHQWGYFTVEALQNIGWWVGLVAVSGITARALNDADVKASLALSLAVSLVFFHVATLAWFPTVTGTGDTEILNGYASQATFIPEHWEERTETYECGTKDSPKTCTRTYNVLVPEQQYLTSNVGQIGIRRINYNYVRDLWGSTNEVKSLNPSAIWGYPNTGDMNKIFRITYQGSPATDLETIVPVSVANRTANYLKPGYAKFGTISDDQVPAQPQLSETKAGPVKLQRVFEVGLNQPTFVADAQLRLDAALALMGEKYQINPLVILVNPNEVSKPQFMSDLEIKWKGGHKNDWIMVIGTTPDMVPQWVETLGLNRNADFATRLRYRMDGKTITPESLVTDIVAQISDPQSGYERIPMEELQSSVSLPIPLWGVLLMAVTAAFGEVLLYLAIVKG